MNARARDAPNALPAREKPAWVGGHRRVVPVQVEHLREIVRECRQPQGGVDQRLAGDHPGTPVAGQQRPRRYAGDLTPGNRSLKQPQPRQLEHPVR